MQYYLLTCESTVSESICREQYCTCMALQEYLHRRKKRQPPPPPPRGAASTRASRGSAPCDSSLSIHACMADHSSIPFRSILTPRYCKPDSLGMPNLGVTDGCMDDVVDQPVVSCSLIIRIGERKRLSVFLYLPIPVDLDHVMQLSE